MMKNTLSAQAAFLLMGCLLPLQAAVIADNFTGGPYGNGTSLGDGTNNSATSGSQAFGLTIGSLALQFISLETIFDNSSFLFTREVSGGIFANNGGIPGNEVASLNTVTLPTQAQNVTITSTTSFLLLPNTLYWFVLTGPVGVGIVPNWQVATNNLAPTGSALAATVGYRSSTNNQATWSVSTVNNQLRINANVADFGVNIDAPEPSTFLLSAAGLLLMGRLIRRR